MLGLVATLALGLAKHFLPTAIGGAVADIVKPIVDGFNDERRMRANEAIAEIERDREVIRAQKEVLLKEQSSWETRWIRPAFAGLMLLYIGSIVLDSINIGWPAEAWAVDTLPDSLEWLPITVLTAYFGLRPVEKLLRRN